MRTGFFCLFIILASLAVAQPAATDQAPYTIAIVRDDASWHTAPLQEKVCQSLREMTAGRTLLAFAESNVPGASNDDATLRQSLEHALADPHIDAVLVIGAHAASIAADPALPLTKPTFGAALVDPDLTQLPYDTDGHSTKPNFAVLVHTARSAELLKVMQGAVPFTSLQILVNAHDASHHDSMTAWQHTLSGALGATVQTVPAGRSTAATLSAIDPAIRTVFLLPDISQSEAEHAALLDGLRKRHHAVLSFTGHQEVEAGALIGALPEAGTQLARRVAIVFDQIQAGVPIAQLTLSVPLRSELFFNEASASEIDFSANFAALHTATLVGAQAPATGAPLSIAEAVAIAMDKNYSLRARVAGTEASRQDVAGAKGTLLPQLAAVGNYQQIDLDRAKASGGLFPEKTLVAGFGLTQTIFDDEAITRIRQARAMLKAATAAEKIQRLDTATSAGQAYLQYLSARAALRVVEQNAQVTHKHLELANLRQRVGTSGPEDIHRFESLSAQQRSETVAARTQVERARTELNRVLGVDPSAQWSPRDTGLDDPAFASLTVPLTSVITNRKRFDHLKTYLMAYATGHSPDLEALEHGVSAQRLVADQKQRRSYIPKISASANLGRLVEQDYGGPTIAEQLNAVGLPVPPADLDRTVWTVGVQASLPLFTGGSLTADNRKARAQLRQMELTRDGARETIQARAQACLASIESSYCNIELSRIAADLAQRNLDVVQRKYEQGTVSIVTLLDAQNTAFAQRQASEVAVYRFLADVLMIERIIGWVEVLATPEENAAWLREATATLNRE